MLYQSRWIKCEDLRLAGSILKLAGSILKMLSAQ